MDNLINLDKLNEQIRKPTVPKKVFFELVGADKNG